MYALVLSSKDNLHAYFPLSEVGRQALKINDIINESRVLGR